MSFPLALSEKFPAVLGNIILDYGSKDWKAVMDRTIGRIKTRINPLKHDAEMAEAWRRPNVAKANMADFIDKVSSDIVWHDEDVDAEEEDPDYYNEELGFYRGERWAFINSVQLSGRIGYGIPSANFGPSCRYQW